MAMFTQMTILGPGLLGASLAMAAKERGLVKRVTAWSRSPATRAKCAQTDWCDAVFDEPRGAVAGSDLVVLCTPVETIVPLLEQVAASLEPGVLVTDVGSTKSLIVRQVQGLDGSFSFVGSHPMAGSERTGMDHAHAGLFKDAACFVTPIDSTPADSTKKTAAFWQALGMVVTPLSPERHDEIVAHISHLPHLLASVLCAYLATKDPSWRNFSGGGLRDTTRVASGDPALWRQILGQNREEVLRSIDGLEAVLHSLRAALSNDDAASVHSLLQKGKTYRDGL